MEMSLLKQEILNKNLSSDLFIFVDKQGFLSKQYYTAISKLLDKKICVVQDLDVFIDSTNNLFGNYDDLFYVYYCSSLDVSNIKGIHNFAVVTEKVSESCFKELESYIINVPDLAEWQIRDYAVVKGKGLGKNEIYKLLSLCKLNIFRLDSELDKLLLFTPDSRNEIFKSFLRDGMYKDLAEYTIFNLVNGILTKNIDDVVSILKTIDVMDVNPFGIISLLYTNIKQIIAIRLGLNVTASDLGVTEKQFNAMKYKANHYTANQLISILDMLTHIDLMLKTGSIPVEHIIDYVILKIFSFGESRVELSN